MSRLLIQFSHLFKFFDSFPLFEDLSLPIHWGEVIALVGKNGAGKTTLLQFLAGMLVPDGGHFVRAPDLRVGFLPQEIEAGSMSARAYIEGVYGELEREMAACLDRQERWFELHERYELIGGYMRVPMEKVLKGLKLDASLLDLSMESLSSGQRVCVALAKALIDNPDLLLLDEPTNHLDRDMVGWLEEAIRMREGATVIVSHNRKFLNAVCSQLVEVKNGKLSFYRGNYDFFLQEQVRLQERQRDAYEAQKEERALLRQQIKAMAFSKEKSAPPKDRNVMAYDRKGEKHQKSLRRKADVLKGRLEEIEENLISNPKQKDVGLRFVEMPLASSVAIELEQVEKGFGGRKLFEGLNGRLCKGDRIVLTGPNGSGKTTLLRCIAGMLSVDAGQIRYAKAARVAYLDQDVELLPKEQMPFQYFGLPEEEIRRALHQAAIGEVELLTRPFSTMSVGQRKRFMLLSLILKKPNVLLLDEPTNHLDFLTLEALETALLNFQGAILAVSHDEVFIEKIATQKWVLPSAGNTF